MSPCHGPCSIADVERGSDEDQIFYRLPLEIQRVVQPRTPKLHLIGSLAVTAIEVGRDRVYIAGAPGSIIMIMWSGVHHKM